MSHTGHPPVNRAQLADRLPFSPTITAATAVRVLQQISRDRGSTALLLVIPCMLMVLLKLMFARGGPGR